MNSSPLVSIVLPAFNAEKTVGDAIASILLQSYPNWELLFIDDGSSDKTLDVARRFKDQRIKIFADGTNLGLPARLNEAIDRAAGKYFARMDQDDLCFPERLERQVEYLEAHPGIDLLGTRAMTFISPSQATGLFPFRETHEEICRQPWKGFYLPHPSWMGRLEWFKKHRYHNVDRAEDQDLLLRSYPSSRFACLPKILFAYRLRNKVSLKINLTARKSLLLSQIKVFCGRSEWEYLMLSVLAYTGKCALDYYKSLTGARQREEDANLLDILSRWEKLKSEVAEMQR
ncbi:MAG: glycosyltransferase family 2 protein [Burkholderiales bacterium]|nr:glycosyltransferase family 2 protein [Burkholderiales bacterium]